MQTEKPVRKFHRGTGVVEVFAVRHLPRQIRFHYLKAGSLDQLHSVTCLDILVDGVKVRTVEVLLTNNQVDTWEWHESNGGIFKYHWELVDSSRNLLMARPIFHHYRRAGQLKDITFTSSYLDDRGIDTAEVYRNDEVTDIWELQDGTWVLLQTAQLGDEDYEEGDEESETDAQTGN